MNCPAAPVRMTGVCDKRSLLMRDDPILRSASYLAAALVLTMVTSGDTFAHGKGNSSKKIEIESMGARAFGGTR